LDDEQKKVARVRDNRIRFAQRNCVKSMDWTAMASISKLRDKISVQKRMEEVAK